MVSETIELRGHIIDSLILPKVLDQILTRGATFKIVEIKIGQKRADQSFARIEVSADSAEALDELMLRLRQHGAEVVERADSRTAPAPADGVFPDEFYVTTNQQTFVRIGGHEIEVQPAMMDSGIAVDTAKGLARAVKFPEVKRGDQIVISHQGIRVSPVQRSTSHTDLFQFINTTVGANEPKGALIREIADELVRAVAQNGKIAAVAGKAVALTGAGEYFQHLIELGFIHRFFTGNAFAVYDVERALFGTSGGMSLGRPLPGVGHENHLRAVNLLRAMGGIQQAVKKKALTSGIMHACVRKNVDIVLTGSIRDDGPIPGVTTDVVEAQKIMREKLADVTHVLLLGTVQHALAVASMLSPSVKTICVDINPAAVALIVNQQPFQSIGLVTDIEPFLRQLCEAIDAERKG
jgi:lysine-ketoglutarate reductase/saccharopine dehydrogenase-like protein (TIGR00300 family)